jgi:alpha-beta hydrolase superfamily lysophospholipase
MIDHQSSRSDTDWGDGAATSRAAGGQPAPAVDGRAPGDTSDAPEMPGDSTARMADGTLLRTLHWPAGQVPWARALIIHGLGEHAGRYPTVAAALTRDGIDVHGYDHRGFGASAGRRAFVERWDQLHEDLEERVTALRAEQPELPLIMWGHSLGGLIACGYVLSPSVRPLPDLVVLSSPALDADIPARKRALLRALAGVLPRTRISNGPLGEGLSHDPAIGEAYASDPLCLSSTTARFAREAFEEQARLRTALETVGSMPVPTYVFHGSADPVVPVAASAPLGELGNVTRHVHEGLRHETHHEYEHEAVLGEVVAWIDARRGSLGDVAPAATREADTPIDAGEVHAVEV